MFGSTKDALDLGVSGAPTYVIGGEFGFADLTLAEPHS